MSVVDFREEKDKREALDFAVNFVSKNGMKEFKSFQKDLKEFLELAEELGLIPEEDLAIINQRRARNKSSGRK